MKILQINSVCGFGSTGRIATDLYKVYEEAGHECVIAYGRGSAPEGYKTIKIGSNMDNYMHVAKTRVFDKHGFGSKRATEKFIEEVKEFNPDIIHLHNIHGYYINIEVLFNYLKEENKKVVWTLHDCWSFTGHCSHFDYVKCFKWKTECGNCQQKAEYPTSKIADNSKWNYEKKKELFTGLKDMTIVTPSNWLAGLVKESFLKEYKVEVIHNGIDLDVFKPTKSDFREKYGIGNKRMILGVASVWTERKGYNYFMELSKELDENYQIVMVGVTEKQKKKLPSNILGIIRTNNVQELVEIYSTADIFFNPTLEENFPTVNLEALACGIPVYTFDTGGSWECISQDTGVIIKEKNKFRGNKIFLEKFEKFNCCKRARRFNKNDKFLVYEKFI
jgi:glycosyltransferase involved in cell wall biosynthesis